MERRRSRGSHGWAEISKERKQEIIAAIVSNHPTSGPAHVELDLTDRCNVACYFCNQQDLRTRESIALPRLTELIDELASSGLKSVRLSGGGDPLFHRDAAAVMDHLARRGVVIDNLTTNAVALTSAIAERLVRGRAREVIVSLNAADADDYARMMQVKPALFGNVLANVRQLLTIRNESSHPSVVLQFLIDRRNLHRIVEMYELGRSAGVDCVAINAVLEIPRGRIAREILLTDEDRFVAEPLVEEMLRRDRDAGLLQIDFAVARWNEMLHSVRQRVGGPEHNVVRTATTFREENGGCFFPWYTAAITGNGDIRPCCLLLSPDVEPLGNIHSRTTFAEHWKGAQFSKMRDEMRDVLISGTGMEWTPQRFAVLQKPCVNQGLCWLKNMYFRCDDDFYRDLGEALARARRGWRWPIIGSKAKRTRALELFLLRHPELRDPWKFVRDRTRPVRLFLKRRFGIRLTKAE